MTKNTVVRKGKFDAGHRVMHERFACFNVHGHEYQYELHFGFDETKAIGYQIDFKEIKRVACAWIDEHFDHAFIANPVDSVMIKACLELKSRLYLMNLRDQKGFCNPTAENIAKELFFSVSHLLDNGSLWLDKVVLFETQNCFVECSYLTQSEFNTLMTSKITQDLNDFKRTMGVLEYDARISNEPGIHA